jgi:ParB family chromosome partitioning protein
MQTDERYTDLWVIEAARATMGGIDLDPASCALANARVKATTYFDENTNGLLQRQAFGTF